MRISHDHFHPPRSASAHGMYEDEYDFGNDDEVQWFLFQRTGTISFRLTTQKPIIVGRDDNCDICLRVSI